MLQEITKEYSIMVNVASFAITLMTTLTFSMISTHRTIITTVIEKNEHETMKNALDNPRASEKQCPKISAKTCCQDYVADYTRPKPMLGLDEALLQLCCTEIKKLKKECMCDGIQQAYDKAQQNFSRPYKLRMFKNAESLPKQCKLEVKECHLVAPKVYAR